MKTGKNAAGWLVPGVLAVLAIHAVWFKAGADFQVFHQAGVRLLHGEPLYRLDEDLLFLYLPGVAQWMTPLRRLPQRLAPALLVFCSARALWRFFSNAAAVGGPSRHYAY